MARTIAFSLSKFKPATWSIDLFLIANSMPPIEGVFAQSLDACIAVE